MIKETTAGVLEEDASPFSGVFDALREHFHSETRPASSRGGLAVGKRELHTSLNEDDVEEAKHCRTAMLDLHDLVACHVTGLNEAKRIVNAERRKDTKVTLREHLNLASAGGWRREGSNLLKERKG